MADIGQAIQVKEELDNSNVDDKIIINILYLDQKDFYIHLKQQSTFNADCDNSQYKKITQNFPESTTLGFEKKFPSSLSPATQLEYCSSSQSDPNAKFYQDNSLDKSLEQNQFFHFKNQPLNNSSFGLNSSYSSYNSISLQQKPSDSQLLSDKTRSMNQIEIPPLFSLSNEKLQKSMTMINSFNKRSQDLHTVLVQNLPRGSTPLIIFRLFGMYGNVQKITILGKTPGTALVEFQESPQALLAKIHLNNCPLYGNNLLVTLEKNDYPPCSLDNFDDMVIDFSNSKYHRYKIMGSKNYKNIAAPSKVLHLSNLCDDKDENFYCELFENYGRIVKIHELKGTSKMILMEMRSITDAVSILVNFHNQDINGKFLKVSFSKYSIIKD